MKIYVVTVGEYSDYGIDKVFVNKELAEKYVDRRNRLRPCWDKYNIEEYDTSDEEPNARAYIRAYASMQLQIKDNNNLVLGSCFVGSNIVETDKILPYVESNTLHDDGSLYIERNFLVADNKSTPFDYEEKMGKIASDLAAEICNAYNDGLTMKQLQEMFNCEAVTVGGED